jgi:hypothetical protein
MYINVIPSIKTSNNGTLLVQTPQTPATLSEEVEKHLKIVGMSQYFLHYNKQMEQTLI